MDYIFGQLDDRRVLVCLGEHMLRVRPVPAHGHPNHASDCAPLAFWIGCGSLM